MVWVLFLSIGAMIYFIIKKNQAEANSKRLGYRLALCYSDQEQRNKAHLAEIEKERALTQAAIEAAAYEPEALDISACIEEMDRLEAEDLLEEIDEEWPR